MDWFWIMAALGFVVYLVIGYIVTIAAHALWYAIKDWDFDRGDVINPFEVLLWIVAIPVFVLLFIIPSAVKAYRINTRRGDKPRKEKFQVRLANRGIRSLRKVLPKTIIKGS